MEFENRFVALGDSFTEGVGDEDPSRPHGVRGWADRVAEQLMAAEAGWGYANLAIRGKRIPQVVSEQLPAAVALKPTLATLYMGGNDLLRPSADIDALMGVYAGAVRRLADTGARLVLFTGFDAVASAVFGRTRGRTAIYNEWVREIAEGHGALVADYWRWREFRDWAYWAPDRLHMNSAGHALMAKKVLGVLGAADAIPEPAPEPRARPTRAGELQSNAQWTREHLGPWVRRRLTGVSSGDSLSPRYPEYVGTL